MSNAPDADDDLEQTLAASRELRARYRAASDDEPSSAVDDALRAQARRAAGARPRAAGSPFGSSWRVPLSIAAVVVVSATLTVMVTREERHVPSADQQFSAPKQPPAAAPPPLKQAPENQTQSREADRPPSQSVPLSTLEQGARAKDQKPDVDLSESKAKPALKDEAVRPDVEKKPEPFPSSPAAPATQSMPPAPVQTAPVPPSSAQVPPSPAQAPPSPATAAPAAEAPKASARGMAEENAAPTGNGMLEKRSSELSRAQDQLKSLRSNAAEEQKQMREQEDVAPRRERPAVQPSEAPAAAEPSRSAPYARVLAPWESDPQAWLRHIETLVRDNKMTEARDSLKAFRQRYPSYRLPPNFPLREP